MIRCLEGEAAAGIDRAEEACGKFERAAIGGPELSSPDLPCD